MTLLDFLLLAAKGAAIGLAIVAPLFVVVVASIRRSEHMAGRKKAERMRRFLEWYENKPDPRCYYGDDWQRQYYHDLAQYARKHGGEPTLK